jgi:phosphoribosyl-ATP pyrophosphohydrolase/phosphoribosyl-AMP cyclohydrolase/histidinol dehydrogenase
MTVIPARVAGVRDVVVASPRPSALMLAAAAVADADQLLAVGGAQAIAALAYGAGAIAPCDVVVGPGNRFVTAAKQCVAADVAIDFLAGPSELLVVADDSADARVVAADLLAQAEHDEEAQPLLLARHESIVAAVERELERQLPTLATAATARAALESHGGAILAKDADEALRIVDAIAPEHLELHVRDADDFGARVRHFGALFVGARSAEVLGDYGAGPNHVLPTGGSARFRGGLSVLDFLRARTWLRMDESGDNDELARDAVALARLEGLEGHARAAELRIGSPRAARTR